MEAVDTGNYLRPAARILATHPARLIFLDNHMMYYIIYYKNINPIYSSFCRVDYALAGFEWGKLGVELTGDAEGSRTGTDRVSSVPKKPL